LRPRRIEAPISCSPDDAPHFEFIYTADCIQHGSQNARLVLYNCVNEFAYMKKSVEWGVLNCTFHPFVIGRGQRIALLENLTRTLTDRGAVFSTVEAAAAEYAGRAPSS